MMEDLKKLWELYKHDPDLAHSIESAKYPEMDSEWSHLLIFLKETNVHPPEWNDWSIQKKKQYILNYFGGQSVFLYGSKTNPPKIFFIPSIINHFEARLVIFSAFNFVVFPINLVLGEKRQFFFKECIIPPLVLKNKNKLKNTTFQKCIASTIQS